MTISALAQLWQSFIPGQRLIDGQDLLNLANLTASAKPTLTAEAGGGQVGATPLPAYINELSVCATANDSCMLPVGLPGLMVVNINDGAQSTQVFGQTLNPNTGVGDTIAAHNSVNQTATATGVAQASASVGIYFCFAPGKWKQTLLT